MKMPGSNWNHLTFRSRKYLTILCMSIGFLAYSPTAQAEIYIVDGTTFALAANIAGFTHSVKRWHAGTNRWIDDAGVICKNTNGAYLAVFPSPVHKIYCLYRLYENKRLMPGWKFIDSEFVKVTSKSTRYRIERRYKNTNNVYHRVRLSINIWAFPSNRAVRLKKVILEGPSGAKWTDALQ